MSGALVAILALIVVLAAIGFGPSVLARYRERRGGREARRPSVPAYDPGRERRAATANGLATAICVAGEALAPTLLAGYPQMRAMLTRLDGTSMTFTAKGVATAAS